MAKVLNSPSGTNFQSSSFLGQPQPSMHARSENLSPIYQRSITLGWPDQAIIFGLLTTRNYPSAPLAFLPALLKSRKVLRSTLIPTWRPSLAMAWKREKGARGGGGGGGGEEEEEMRCLTDVLLSQTLQVLA